MTEKGSHPPQGKVNAVHTSPWWGVVSVTTGRLVSKEGRKL